MIKEINGRKFKLLITSSDIANKVQQLGKQITEDYTDKNLLIVGILKGSFVFLSDLIRSIETKTEIDFIRLSSYKNKMAPDDLELITDLGTRINNRDVLLVDDLLDTGGTLTYIRDIFLSREPKSFKICTLIKKNKYREKNIDPDYVGFEIEDKFIVGYGTDFAEEGRNLPDVYVIED